MIEKFEIGKFYKNVEGTYIHVVSEADTTMWGRCFIAETPDDTAGLVPLREVLEVAEWEEVELEEWGKQFDMKI